MPVHLPPHLTALFRFIKGGSPSMALKRHIYITSYYEASKRFKFDFGHSFYERQWENVYKADDDTSEWFKFTVASYNILAQNLLETNKHLYRKCLTKHLNWQHRKNIIREELVYHQPDILCLQEVHFHEFSRFFLPELQKLGYFGLYKKRTSEKEDGCATFFKHEKFVCVASKAMEFKQKGVEVLDRDNVGLVLLLKPVLPSKNGRKAGNGPKSEADKKLNDLRLCVANTHLLFNPKRGDIKLAQLMTLLAGIDEVTGGMKHSVIMCGDFNSHPRSGILNFLTSGRLDLKDVSVKFFSGQISPSKSESVDDSSGFERVNLSPLHGSLSPTFMEKAPSITDQCQFVDVLRKRSQEGDQNLSKKLRVSYSSASRNTSRWKPQRQEKDEEGSSLTDYISWPDSPTSYTQGSGLITHKLNLNSVYDYEHHKEDEPSKQITCFLERNCNTVDYILYSNADKRDVQPPSSSSESSSSDFSTSDLHLLRRFRLFTESEIKSHYKGMPNEDLGSDHTILLSEFGIKLS